MRGAKTPERPALSTHRESIVKTPHAVGRRVTDGMSSWEEHAAGAGFDVALVVGILRIGQRSKGGMRGMLVDPVDLVFQASLGLTCGFLPSASSSISMSASVMSN
jgi:hypothetical protein